MFDIAFSELVLIALLALVVLGPKRLPEVARTAGRWTAKIRCFITDVKQDFDRELHQADLSELRRLKEELDDTRRLMQETSGKIVSDLAAVGSAAAASNGTANPTIAPPPVGARESSTTKKSRPRKKSVTKPPSKKKHVATRKVRSDRRS